MLEVGVRLASGAWEPDLRSESACQTGPSLELSCRLEAGGYAVRASPGGSEDFHLIILISANNP